MDGFDRAAWLPLSAGLTALGLILSWTAWRRRGAGAGLRGVAWSLLPLAAYLTGVIELVSGIVSDTVRWATRLVFSLTAWAGVAVAGLSLVLFVVSGMLRRRRPEEGGPPTVPGKTTSQLEPKRTAEPAASDDFAEVEEILRRRGIS